MKKLMTATVALILMFAMLAVPVCAEDVTAAESEIVTVTETASVTLPETETAIETETETETEAETKPAVQVDEWIYKVMQQATPDQVELIEEIVLGGLNALEKLEIEGYDRVRVWVEHNMATVMVLALIVALVVMIIAGVIQKKGFAKKADLLNENAIVLYEKGQEEAEKARKDAKDYADRADRICRECADAAQKTADTAADALEQIKEERAEMTAELEKTRRTMRAMTEEINFLLQCSDLPQYKRDEAEAIFRRGTEESDGSQDQA